MNACRHALYYSILHVQNELKDRPPSHFGQQVRERTIPILVEALVQTIHLLGYQHLSN
jgi:hypothetical protein